MAINGVELVQPPVLPQLRAGATFGMAKILENLGVEYPARFDAESGSWFVMMGETDEWYEVVRLSVEAAHVPKRRPVWDDVNVDRMFELA